MPQNSPNHHKSNWMIAVLLILCICFLTGAEIFFLSSSEQKNHTTVLAESSPDATPSPTPFPTEEPKEIPPSDNPDDPYPELYGDNPHQEFDLPEENIVYLTFDDGPSKSTPALLEVLREEGVPATFFIAEDDYPELLKQIYQDGHTIGVHTYSHLYHYVYWNKEAYLADFSRCYYAVWDATGYRPRIFRFPGGSVNSYNSHLAFDLISEMEKRGFVYYDWNVTSEDASGADTHEEQLEQLITQSENKTRIIALLHDTPKNSIVSDVVRDYIRYMKEKGYRFAALDSSVKPVHFPRPNP